MTEKADDIPVMKVLVSLVLFGNIAFTLMSYLLLTDDYYIIASMADDEVFSHSVFDIIVIANTLTLLLLTDGIIRADTLLKSSIDIVVDGSCTFWWWPVPNIIR